MKDIYDEHDEHRFSDDGNPHVPDHGDPQDCPPNCPEGGSYDEDHGHITDQDVLDDLSHKNVREPSASGDLESLIREAASEAPEDSQAGKEMTEGEYTELLATRAQAKRKQLDSAIKRGRLRNDRRSHGQSRLYTGRELAKRGRRRKAAAKSRKQQRDHGKRRHSKIVRLKTGGKASGRQ